MSYASKSVPPMSDGPVCVFDLKNLLVTTVAKCRYSNLMAKDEFKNLGFGDEKQGSEAGIEEKAPADGSKP